MGVPTNVTSIVALSRCSFNKLVLNRKSFKSTLPAPMGLELRTFELEVHHARPLRYGDCLVSGFNHSC